MELNGVVVVEVLFVDAVVTAAATDVVAPVVTVDVGGCSGTNVDADDECDIATGVDDDALDDDGAVVVICGCLAAICARNASSESIVWSSAESNCDQYDSSNLSATSCVCASASCSSTVSAMLPGVACSSLRPDGNRSPAATPKKQMANRHDDADSVEVCNQTWRNNAPS